MQILLNNDKIMAWATVGSLINGTEVDESLFSEEFFNTFVPEKYLYVNNTVVENPDYIPVVPIPEPTIKERLEELETQNQMLTDCILEMSEIVYGE